MEEMISVGQLHERLLALSGPLAALDLPLLDAHGATLASDLLLDDEVVIKNGHRVGATQIALAASLGLDRLPCRPQPRVVIISAGDDLVEPGSKLASEEDEFESNSWFLTTFVREAGAHAFRVHTIPETSEQLQMIIEDQLVRADLIVISGESGDESFDLITSVVSKLGEIKVVIPNLAESGKHNYGLIGPEKTPVITLPGDPVCNYLSAEIFIRPMILKMSGKTDIYRTTRKVKLSKTITSGSGKSRYLRAVINSDDQAVALEDQNSLTSISSSTCLISLNEKVEKVSAGELVEVVIINADKL